MTKDRVVLFEKKGPITYITLNRPEKINAMNGEMYDQLAEAVKKYVIDNDSRCAVISGAGGNFSSGGDLKFFEEWHKTRGQDAHYDFPPYHELEHCMKPVIAAVDGFCLASGFNLAVLYSDIRIASERAKMGIPAVARGLPLPYSLPLTWHMTLGNALYVLLTGKQLTAEEALRMGVVSEVVSYERLIDRATELAMMIAEAAPMHVQCHKEFMRRFVEAPGSFGQRLAEIIMRPLDFSEDTIEGKRAFLEKRKAVYRNK